jgi:acylphosphatase
MKHINIRVKGKVQGVFYRATMKAVADQVGVKGYILNEKDGSVYIEAEGDDFSLETFLEFCTKGSDKAVVEGVDVADGDLKSFKNFEIVRKNLAS